MIICLPRLKSRSDSRIRMEFQRITEIFFDFKAKKKVFSVNEKTFVGVAGFEPAASCSQSRRDNRATLHPVSGCKYSNKFLLEKENLKINKTYFDIVI